MDIKDTFKKLLTSQFIPDLNYMEVKFSFLTVFKNSSHTYRCCTCAYQHEYLDYVSKTGKVNEEMFDKVVGYILNGKCLHVADVPEDCVTETCIFPIHICSWNRKSFRRLQKVLWQSQRNRPRFNTWLCFPFASI